MTANISLPFTKKVYETKPARHHSHFTVKDTGSEKCTCTVPLWPAASWKWHLDIALDSRKYTFSSARIWGHVQCVCPPHSPMALTCSRPMRRYLKNLDGGNQRRDRHRNPRIRISNAEEVARWQLCCQSGGQPDQIKARGVGLQKKAPRKKNQNNESPDIFDHR